MGYPNNSPWNMLIALCASVCRQVATSIPVSSSDFDLRFMFLAAVQEPPHRLSLYKKLMYKINAFSPQLLSNVYSERQFLEN